MALYFPEEEVKGLNLDLIELLDMARRLSGVTFFLFHKKPVVETTDVKEIDLRCEDDHARFHIVRSLLNSGLNRIGIADGYIHVEYEEGPINRMWFI